MNPRSKDARVPGLTASTSTTTSEPPRPEKQLTEQMNTGQSPVCSGLRCDLTSVGQPKDQINV